MANKPTIMIVDDDSLLRSMLKAILRGEDYEVIAEATNGEDAIQIYRTHKPGIVLLDINMPRADGLQVLEEIRAIDSRALIIMISGEATVDRVRDSLKKGAAGFIVKPFNTGKVLKAISDCLRANPGRGS